MKPGVAHLPPGMDLSVMTVAAQASAENPAAMLATVIVGVSVATAIFGWMMWRGWKSAECA